MQWGKVTLVIVCAVFVTALGIDAADTIQGSESTLLARVTGGAREDRCPSGMRAVEGVPGVSCVDVYEASPSDACTLSRPASVLESERNLAELHCVATSREGVYPWTYVTLPQSQRACAGAGKRLPTSEEWYKLALGVQEASCVINASEAQQTGGRSCVSLTGAHDMVGNVWEWVEGDVFGKTVGAHTLPNEGYVTGITSAGFPATSRTDTGDPLFGNDYAWTQDEGVFNMIRGGFYGSGDDAGVYTLNAAVPIQSAAPGVGFRCVTS